MMPCIPFAGVVGQTKACIVKLRIPRNAAASRHLGIRARVDLLSMTLIMSVYRRFDRELLDAGSFRIVVTADKTHDLRVITASTDSQLTLKFTISPGRQ